MARPKSSLRKTRNMLNRLLVGLVSVFGFLSAITILTAPSPVEAPESAREPASKIFMEPATAAPKDRNKINVVKLTCDKEMRLDETASQIRLKGKVCTDKTLAIEKSSIKNSENQDVATIFHQAKDFTTDVIHLKPGQNKLVITNLLSDGTTSTQVLIVNRTSIQNRKTQ